MNLGEVEIFAGAYNLGYLKKYEGMFPPRSITVWITASIPPPETI